MGTFWAQKCCFLKITEVFRVCINKETWDWYRSFLPVHFLHTGRPVDCIWHWTIGSSDWAAASQAQAVISVWILPDGSLLPPDIVWTTQTSPRIHVLAPFSFYIRMAGAVIYLHCSRLFHYSTHLTLRWRHTLLLAWLTSQSRCECHHPQPGQHWATSPNPGKRSNHQ